jgi:hypothetical protein
LARVRVTLRLAVGREKQRQKHITIKLTEIKLSSLKFLQCSDDHVFFRSTEMQEHLKLSLVKAFTGHTQTAWRSHKPTLTFSK